MHLIHNKYSEILSLTKNKKCYRTYCLDISYKYLKILSPIYTQLFNK